MDQLPFHDRITTAKSGKLYVFAAILVLLGMFGVMLILSIRIEPSLRQFMVGFVYVGGVAVFVGIKQLVIISKHIYKWWIIRTCKPSVSDEDLSTPNSSEHQSPESSQDQDQQPNDFNVEAGCGVVDVVKVDINQDANSVESGESEVICPPSTMDGPPAYEEFPSEPSGINAV